MLDMVRRWGKVLENTTDNARRNRAVSEAGQWQDADRQHSGRSGRTDVPAKGSGLDRLPRHESKLAAAHVQALRLGSAYLAACLNRRKMLRS
jgi:hypothetical protein